MHFTERQLKEKTNALARASHVSSQEVLQNYMFERILFRISKSKYSKRIILKGGLLVSSISGISSRTTMDMDAVVKGIRLDKDRLHTVLNEVLSIDVQDGVQFEITSSDAIQEEDEYGGFRFKLFGLIGKIKVFLSIDFSTGDVVTPEVMDYQYPMMFEGSYFSIKSYPVVTILAEKIQTILERNGAKGRMKDYYDVHFFITNRMEEINIEMLHLAVQNTFTHRQTLDDLNHAEEILKSISVNLILQKRWLDYSIKHDYSSMLSFQDVLNAIDILIRLVK